MKFIILIILLPVQDLNQGFLGPWPLVWRTEISTHTDLQKLQGSLIQSNYFWEVDTDQKCTAKIDSVPLSEELKSFSYYLGAYFCRVQETKEFSS